MITYRIISTSLSMPGARFCSMSIESKDEAEKIRKFLSKDYHSYLESNILKQLFGSALPSITGFNRSHSFIQSCTDNEEEGSHYMVISSSISMPGARFCSQLVDNMDEAEKIKNMLASNNLSEQESNILRGHFGSAIPSITGFNKGYSYIQATIDTDK